MGGGQAGGRWPDVNSASTLAFAQSDMGRQLMCFQTEWVLKGSVELLGGQRGCVGEGGERFQLGGLGVNPRERRR